MMHTTTEQARPGPWPPQEGQSISFKSSDGWETATLRRIRRGLVWKDFVLDDGRVIPEHNIAGCPQPPLWRNAIDVTHDEREAWEERLISMAEAGLDPRDREQSFWAELNQYLAYTYLRFKQTGHQSPDVVRRLKMG